MGIEAVAKQAESTVFISGLGPLGVEIAKNIILAGCKELVLDDKCTMAPEDLDGQFFLEEKDIGSTKTRA
jgi:molybdopterin/thiamine biosynthesis adenylyltransferase